jgi:hypothetical protein
VSALSRVLASLAEALRAELDTERGRVERKDAAGALSISGTERPALLELVMTFSRPLRIPIAMRRMREKDLWDLWHDPPITFEDPAFDDAMLVRGEPEDSVRALLDSETRALFVRICECSDDLVLSADRLVVERRSLDRGVIDLAEEVLVLSRRLLGIQSSERSAYR